MTISKRKWEKGMGDYIKKKKDMKFEGLESLKTVENIFIEIDEASNDKYRTINTSAIPEVLAGAAGVGIGGGIGFAALYFGGPVVGLNAAGITGGLAAAGHLVGGGMAAGIGVLAAPAVVLGVAGVGIAAHQKNKKLQEAKSLCYKEALKKQSQLVTLLENEKNADEKRIEYLNSLNILLQAAIKDLKHDLQEE